MITNCLSATLHALFTSTFWANRCDTPTWKVKTTLSIRYILCLLSPVDIVFTILLIFIFPTQGLAFLIEHEVSELGYDLTFSTEVQEFGVTEARDLKPNGSNITVTEENKMDYIRLVCQMKMTGAIRKQLNAFLEGFYDIIPKRLISIFNEQELELLISGLPNIDIDDLKANSEYHKYQPTSLQVTAS